MKINMAAASSEQTNGGCIIKIKPPRVLYQFVSRVQPCSIEKSVLINKTRVRNILGTRSKPNTAISVIAVIFLSSAFGLLTLTRSCVIY